MPNWPQNPEQTQAKNKKQQRAVSTLNKNKQEVSKNEAWPTTQTLQKKSSLTSTIKE